MHSTPSPRFGLEPQVWRRHGQAVVAELLGSPVLRWLVPVATVLVRTADGAERAARLTHGELRPAAADHPTAHALPVLEMPAERVLLRSLPMPAMASSDLSSTGRATPGPEATDYRRVTSGVSIHRIEHREL